MSEKVMNYSKVYKEDLHEMYIRMKELSPILSLDYNHPLCKWLEDGYKLAKKREVKTIHDYYMGMRYYYCGFRNGGHLGINLYRGYKTQVILGGDINYIYDRDVFKLYNDDRIITHINSMPIKKYLETKIMPYIGLDGFDINISSYIIAVRYIRFINIGDKIVITFKDGSNKIYDKKVDIDAKYIFRLPNIPHYEIKKKGNIFVDNLFNKYLWLDINSFADTLHNQEYDKFLSTIKYKLTQGIETLFIDLRYNSGGYIYLLFELIHILFGEELEMNNSQLYFIHKIRNQKSQNKYYKEDAFKTKKKPIEFNTRKKLKIVILTSLYTYSAATILLKVISQFDNVFIYGILNKENYSFVGAQQKDIVLSKNKLIYYYLPMIMFIVSKDGGIDNTDMEIKTNILPYKLNNIKTSNIELIFWLLNDIKNKISL